MATLRARGLSCAEVGRRLGVTKQAVQLALRKLAEPPRSVPCARCGRPIVSAGVLTADVGNALCLPCLAQTPGATFAQRLRALRLAAGLTRVELERRAGLKRGTAGRYENRGHTPGAEALARLARVLPGLLGGGGPRAKG